MGQTLEPTAGDVGSGAGLVSPRCVTLGKAQPSLSLGAPLYSCKRLGRMSSKLFSSSESAAGSHRPLAILSQSPLPSGPQKPFSPIVPALSLMKPHLEYISSDPCFVQFFTAVSP